MAAGSLDQLMPMLKALADESRLALMWQLYREEHTVGDLAERVELSEPTVSHHLSKLREAGLVNLRMAGNQRFYRVNSVGLTKFKRLINEIEKLSPEPDDVVVSDNQWIAALGWSEEEQQVLREHTLNGKLVRIPAKQKKWLVVLRWLVTKFEAERLYTRTGSQHDSEIGLRTRFRQPAPRPGGFRLSAARARGWQILAWHRLKMKSVRNKGEGRRQGRLSLYCQGCGCERTGACWSSDCAMSRSR